METIPSNDARLAEDELRLLLIRVHLLRKKKEFDEARLQLDEALVRWPQSQEIKDLLLQTEKDQLADKRLKSGNDSEMDIGMFERPWQAVVIGLLGLACMGGTLFIIGETIMYMVRFGVAAPWAVAVRGMNSVYYVPTYTTLSIPLLGFCFFLWIFVQALKSLRS